MYRQLVGSLIYLTLTRSNISFAVGVASRLQNPKKPHVEAVGHILRYVKKTIILVCYTRKEEQSK